MKHILLVDSDLHLLLALQDHLEAKGYDVATAVDGESGLRKAMRVRPDALILEAVLPGMSGFEICRTLRRRGVRIPILIASTRSHETDRLHGFEVGADDYLAKPFSVPELLARLSVLLRRAQAPESPAALRLGAIEIDLGRRQARREMGVIPLSTLEAEVLRYLIGHRGEVVSREQLLSDVWGYHASPVTRSVDNLIVRLRAKVEADASQPRHILTVHGTGYTFVD